jgi:hypothetical protein
VILHCSEEANPGCSAAEPSHMPEVLGQLPGTVPGPALTAWIVVFERSEGIKGKPLSGGEAALDTLAAFKEAGHPSDQGLNAAGASDTAWARAPPMPHPFPPRPELAGALDRGPHMRVGKIALTHRSLPTHSGRFCPPYGATNSARAQPAGCALGVRPSGTC